MDLDINYFIKTTLIGTLIIGTVIGFSVILIIPLITLQIKTDLYIIETKLQNKDTCTYTFKDSKIEWETKQCQYNINDIIYLEGK